jgi:superfamily II DNA or RNA helicase
MTELASALAGVLPVYEIPDDDLVGQVLIPAMSTAAEVRLGAGYFSSRCLAQLAPGLVEYISKSHEPLRVLLSPEISDEDRAAIERGIQSPVEVIEKAVALLFEEARLSESALVQHTLDCLAYLVAADRLELRFVLMERGMYHKKKWLFREGDVWAAVHGSGNATTRGLIVNGEQMTIDRPWMDGPSSKQRVEMLVGQWERQWKNEHPHSLTLSAPQGLKVVGARGPNVQVPTIQDFWIAWRTDYMAGLEPELPPNVRGVPHLLSIPDHLEWRTGPYKHQGLAVEEYLAANGRGVLAIATGGGKTRTSLIAATELQDRHDGPMLIVVLVPSRPLMLQWSQELIEFGVIPVLPSLLDGPRRRAHLEEVKAALAIGGRRTEVIVTTNSLFDQDATLRGLVDTIRDDVETMLIGDEMHNLGVPSFLRRVPDHFNRRLGLSATPIRQYDPDGTDKLFAYFGSPVFEFELGDAIRAGCLTPYRYVLHEVQLTAAEMDKYAELTEELRSSGFHVDDDGQTVVPNAKTERLLRERRAVLEQAEGKLMVLRRELENQGSANVQRTLIYTSAKGPVLYPRRQIELVNELLSSLGIISHQFTSAETSRPDAQDMLERFGRGEYQVLTAMRVLDEGMDIPQTDTAYILASSTVRREWVQRRGRILRKAPGKKIATVHDFLVIPPDPSSNYGRSVLRGELRRAEEFTQLAENEWEPNGPRMTISRYESEAWAGGRES